MSYSKPSEIQKEPHLEPPGAGLPPMELFIGRLLFGLRCWQGSRKSFTADFHREIDEIKKLITGVEPEEAGRRVLIERAIGMEDSSRYWSLWMTLDHLRIVNFGIAEIIRLLGTGVAPSSSTNIADVKPSPDVTESVIQQYEASCDKVLVAAASIKNLKTSVLHPHPWFGPMDAYRWYALVGWHLGIHRVQIQRILAVLRTF